MKKIISILLIITMLTIPTAFADENVSNDLQSVLIEKKKKITVPEELGEFESNAKKHIQDAIDKVTKEKWYNLSLLTLIGLIGFFIPPYLGG